MVEKDLLRFRVKLICTYSNFCMLYDSGFFVPLKDAFCIIWEFRGN